MTDKPAPVLRPRPLSPHLQVYRLPLLAILSISHRISGVALCAGMAVFVWWLVATALGPAAYTIFTDFVTSPPGLVLLAGWTVCFFYHLANGVRHLCWDLGLFLDLPAAYSGARIVLALTAILSIAAWLWAWFLMGRLS